MQASHLSLMFHRSFKTTCTMTWSLLLPNWAHDLWPPGNLDRSVRTTKTGLLCVNTRVCGTTIKRLAFCFTVLSMLYQVVVALHLVSYFDPEVKHFPGDSDSVHFICNSTFSTGYMSGFVLWSTKRPSPIFAKPDKFCLLSNTKWRQSWIDCRKREQSKPYNQCICNNQHICNCYWKRIPNSIRQSIPMEVCSSTTDYPLVCHPHQGSSTEQLMV